MANRLTMVTIDAILALRKAGYSNRKIAQLLDVDRETVGKYLAQGESKPATSASSKSCIACWPTCVWRSEGMKE